MVTLIQRKALSLYTLYYLLKRGSTLKKAMKDPRAWIPAQNREIRNFVKYVYNIPFYRKRFDSANVKPADIKTREDFKKLPPLTKEEYREWLLEETKDKSKFKHWMYRQTTGSSGTPLDLYSLPSDRAAEIANLFRCAILQEKGFNPFFSRVFSTMAPKPAPRRRFMFPYNGKLSSVSPPSELVAGYNAARPDFYYGNKTAVLSIARWALDHKIPLHKPLCVGSISEALDDVARATIGRAFGEDKLFDIYGCAETGNFAVDRPSEPNKHTIWNDTHVVNLLNESPVEGRQGVYVGQLILTSLAHRGFPLVNYLVGDTVELTLEEGVPYITKIVGRTNDKIKNSDGSSFVWMHVNRVMFGLTDVAQFRVIQKSYSDLVFVLAARNMSDERKSEIENTIRAKAADVFGAPDVLNGKKILVEWKDEIPPDPTGKIRILISEVE